MRALMIFVSLLLVSPGLASHTETSETGWFEYVYDDSDDAVLYCNALHYITVSVGVETHEGDRVDEALYIHDRPGPDAPYGTGLVSDGGGGTFVWQESNGIKGLQVGVEPFSAPWPVSEFIWTVEPGYECPNGDTVLF